MKLSLISIQRPVLATVLSLTIVLFGVIAFTQLPVREYPDIDPRLSPSFHFTVVQVPVLLKLKFLMYLKSSLQHLRVLKL